MQTTDVVRQSSERVSMLPLHSTSGKNNLLNELNIMVWKYVFNLWLSFQKENFCRCSFVYFMLEMFMTCLSLVCESDALWSQ